MAKSIKENTSTLIAGDIEIGAVEIKNGTTDDRLDILAPTVIRDATVDHSAAKVVKASAGNLFGWNLYNPNTYDVYVKFYNTAAASVVIGTTPVVKMIQVPSAGSVVETSSSLPLQAFTTAISMAATRLPATSDATAIASAVIAEISYK